MKKKTAWNYVWQIILMFMLGIVAVLLAKNVGQLQTKGTAWKEPQTEYEWTLVRLKELEQLAKKYDEEQTEALTYIYVRCEKYDALSWMMMAGGLPEEFQAYVTEHQTMDLQKLQTQDTLELPNGEQCDFVHLIAVMNMLEKQYPVVGGWGGDLVQLASSMKDFSVKESSGSFEALLEQAKKRLGAADSMFNEMDIFADMDALNLHQRKETKKAELWSVMEQYYAEITVKKRVQEFLTNQFGKASFANAELRDIIYQTFEGDTWVQLLCKNYGIDTKDYIEHRRASTYAFADYCYTFLQN